VKTCSHGGAFLDRPQNFLVPRKIRFKHILKIKIYPSNIFPLSFKPGCGARYAYRHFDKHRFSAVTFDNSATVLGRCAAALTVVAELSRDAARY